MWVPEFERVPFQHFFPILETQFYVVVFKCPIKNQEQKMQNPKKSNMLECASTFLGSLNPKASTVSAAKIRTILENSGRQNPNVRNM